MISLIVTTDGDTNYNLREKDAEFGHVMEQFAEPYEIIYTICSDYGFKDELSRIVCEQKNRHLVISAPSTNINTQIYSAMDVSDNGDVLLCTIDTNPQVMLDILNKHFDGADLVFVRHKENWFKSIFTSLGKWTYQLGLKILGHGQDMCCDARVIYLNARSINTIIMNPTLSKALRLVSADPEKTLRVITEKNVYENPTYEQKQINKSIFTLGIISMIYILALIAMALIFPFYNGGMYTGWLLLGLIVWIFVGILACVFASKTIYKIRLGYPVAVDLQNEPVLNIEDYISYNYELAKKFYEEESTTPSAITRLKQKVALHLDETENDKVTESKKAKSKSTKSTTKSTTDKDSKKTKTKSKKTKVADKSLSVQQSDEQVEPTEAESKKETKKATTRAKKKSTKSKPEVSKVSNKSKSKIK